MRPDTTDCIRCDSEVPTDPGNGLDLTYNQEEGAVKACDDCAEIVKRRDYWR